MHLALENIAEAEEKLCKGIVGVLRKIGRSAEIQEFKHRTGDIDISFETPFYRAVLKERPSTGFLGRITGDVKDWLYRGDVSAPIDGAVLGFYSLYNMVLVNYKWVNTPIGYLQVFFYQPTKTELIVPFNELAGKAGYIRVDYKMKHPDHTNWKSHTEWITAPI